MPRITYLIEARSCALLKVGKALDLDTRFRALCGQSPVDVRLLGAIPDRIFGELQIHDALKAYRHHGEWFRLTPAVRAFVGVLIQTAADQWEGDVFSDEPVVRQTRSSISILAAPTPELGQS